LKVTIIGSGYVGLVTGACLAEQGNNVFCVDVDPKKIEILNSGGVPIYEPGLKEMIERNRAAGRLQFSTDIAASVAHGDIQFIAVGTPPDEDGSADLQYVVAAARNIGRHMTSAKVIVDKSTVPVGTADKVSAAISEELTKRSLSPELCSVVSNPEFLKEGAAVEGFMRPDRIVIGTQNTPAGLRAKEQMRKLYAPFNRHHERTYYMDVKSAELTKYAANAMLATRISFMNELANLADLVGADIEAVRQGIGSDSRIGSGFLRAGLGFSGPCIPKDLECLIETAKNHNVELNVLKAARDANNKQNQALINKIKTHFGENLTGLTFGIFGVASKSGGNSLERAPSIEICSILSNLGAKILVYDPTILPETMDHFFSILGPESVKSHCKNILDACKKSNGLLILSNSSQFLEIEKIVNGNPDFVCTIFDFCNLFEKFIVHNQRIKYVGIGRSFIS
jgi:UDPglucose 6-dehydrogenase